jgi:hypothetical protein
MSHQNHQLFISDEGAGWGTEDDPIEIFDEDAQSDGDEIFEDLDLENNQQGMSDFTQEQWANTPSHHLSYYIPLSSRINTELNLLSVRAENYHMELSESADGVTPSCQILGCNNQVASTEFGHIIQNLCTRGLDTGWCRWKVHYHYRASTLDWKITLLRCRYNGLVDQYCPGCMAEIIDPGTVLNMDSGRAHQCWAVRQQIHQNNLN